MMRTSCWITSCFVLVIGVPRSYGFSHVSTTSWVSIKPVPSKPKVPVEDRMSICIHTSKGRLEATRLNARPIPTSEEELLSQLREYLQIREQSNSSGAPGIKNDKKSLGGSRGNFFLEFTSTAPQVLIPDEEKGSLDYDELTKYGFTHLVKPIMQSGGRKAMYEKLGLTPPPPPERLKPKTARKLEIDRDGEKNPTRYTGLKMTTLVNDDEMAAALERASNKRKPVAPEDDFKVPFSDLPKKQFKETPLWTPEMIDRDAEVRGKAISWAKQQRLEREKGIVKDGTESLLIEGSLRIYCSLAMLTTAVAFGKASPIAFDALGLGNYEVLQAPALGLDIASVGSGIVAGLLLAPQKNRSSFVWGMKGLLGGPSALIQLRQLESLQNKDEN